MKNNEFPKNEEREKGLFFLDRENIGSKLSYFKKGNKLGEGSFGPVYEVISLKSKIFYAMKEIIISKFKSLEQFREVKKNIESLELINHPYLIKYFTSFEEKGNFYIIKEFINNCTSFGYIIKNNILMEEKKIWEYLHQSLRALLYLYEIKKTYHGNIKPDNILIDKQNNNLKMTDYGIYLIKGKDNNKNSAKTSDNSINNYFLENDIHNLGLVFSFITEKTINISSNINSFKEKAYFYSEDLRNYINKLKSIEKPSLKSIYLEVISIYSSIYLNFSSVYSTLQCLLSIPLLSDYFNGNDINSLIKNDENTITQKYSFIKLLKETFENINPNNFNYDNAKNKCIQLRGFMYLNYRDKIIKNEIDINDFISDLLSKIHKTLNKCHKKSNRFKNSINFEEEYKDKKYNINESNEKEVTKNAIEQFTIQNNSIIFELFYYIEKIENKCKKCNNRAYSFNINNICEVYPFRASNHFKRKEINITDLFRHYRKEREFSDLRCKICKDNIIKTKIFYFSPKNLILKYDYNIGEENNFKLNFEENINIKFSIERDDLGNYNYNLVGAIFIEQDENNENKYVSISKNGKFGWIYFDGKSVQKCTFKDLNKHKQLKILFYSNIK